MCYRDRRESKSCYDSKFLSLSNKDKMGVKENVLIGEVFYKVRVIGNMPLCLKRKTLRCNDMFIRMVIDETGWQVKDRGARREVRRKREERGPEKLRAGPRCGEGIEGRETRYGCCLVR